MELARRGAPPLPEGRNDLGPRLAGLFRARRDDPGGAGGLRRREAEKYGQTGWYTARLLRVSQLASLTQGKRPA